MFYISMESLEQGLSSDVLKHGKSERLDPVLPQNPPWYLPDLSKSAEISISLGFVALFAHKHT
jgi:hypothetical protein